jgi:DNA-binding response OmpR family regulator
VSPRPPGPLLLVESDRERGRALARQLLADGYAVELARSAEHARVLARAAAPAIVLLGALDQPRGSLALLEEIRAAQPGAGTWDRAIPVIFAGPDRHELDVLRAFDAGADDVIASGTGYLELRARLRALLRRTTADDGRRRLEIGPLAIDIDAHAASMHGHTLELRRMEFELLAHMARDPTRVFSREELLRSVWGYRGAGGSTRTVDSHASRLRRKLAGDPARRWMVNVWGVGYRLS